MLANLSVRTKFWLVTAFVSAVGFAIGVSMVEFQSQELMPVFIAWIFVATFLMFRVKCPNCGTSVVYQGKFLGLPIFAGFVNQKCKVCGYDFKKQFLELRP
jgi:hypothetical protein